MDMSASFQFTVDELDKDWFVIAPDWRGFGLSDWAPQGYWFPDYVADLSRIINIISPDAEISLVGHSTCVQQSDTILVGHNLLTFSNTNRRLTLEVLDLFDGEEGAVLPIVEAAEHSL